MRTDVTALRYTPDTRRKAIESITAELLAYCQRRAEVKEKEEKR